MSPKKKPDVPMRRDKNRGLVPWSEFCVTYGHYYRKDGSCVCGAKGTPTLDK